MADLQSIRAKAVAVVAECDDAASALAQQITTLTQERDTARNERDVVQAQLAQLRADFGAELDALDIADAADDPVRARLRARLAQ